MDDIRRTREFLILLARSPMMGYIAVNSNAAGTCRHRPGRGRGDEIIADRREGSQTIENGTDIE